MSKFHINSQGQVRPCKAHSGKCPFGESLHYGSEQAALNAFDKAMNKITSNENQTLTDRQYDIGKTVNMTTKVMAKEIGKRDDYQQAVAYLKGDHITASDVMALYNNSEQGGDIQEMMKLDKHKSLPIMFDNYDEGIESASQTMLLDGAALRGISHKWAREIKKKEGLRADMSPVTKLYEAAIANPNNNIEATDAINILKDSKSINMYKGVRALTNSNLTAAEIISVQKAFPGEFNKVLSVVDEEAAQGFYATTGEFNIQNKNLSPFTLYAISQDVDLTKETRTIRSANYSVRNPNGSFNYHHPIEFVAGHPNADDRVHRELKKRYPEEYNTYVDYNGTKKSKGDIQKELFKHKESSKLNSSGTYKEDTYEVDKNTIRKYNLSNEQVEELLYTSNVDSSYDSEKGILKVKTDSGD